MRYQGAPIERAASMYWLFFSDNEAPRTIRNVGGMMKSEITIITFCMFGPSIRTMIRSQINAGNAMIASTMRCIRLSIQPPK